MSVQDDLDKTEIWEATTDASTWLWVLDHLTGRGAWKKQKVGGPHGNARISITVRERRYNQDRVPSNSTQHDPFLNGSLICRQGDDQSPNGYTDDQLIELLNIPTAQDAEFEKVVTEVITSEVLLRRLSGLADRHAPPTAGTCSPSSSTSGTGSGRRSARCATTCPSAASATGC